MNNEYHLAPDEAQDAFVNDSGGGTVEPERRIIAKHVYPPIPVRTFDWIAYYDGNEEEPHGFGETEQEAIENLKELD